MKMLFLGAALVLTLPMVSSAETRFASGPAKTALVELYTSEGCSSCPPAEAWMSRLKDNPGLWKQFVPIAFHVDYWNNLGWRDRFSSAKWTERQRRYGALWNSTSVYTPAVVMNGDEVRNWSSRNPALPNDAKTGSLTARTANGQTFEIEFKPTLGEQGDWQVHAALLTSGISEKIGAGENSGRNLKHDFVVMALHDAPMKTEGGTQHASLTLASPNKTEGRRAVAVWVTSGDRLAPVQATGGWLP
ncbi:MAG: DUF1223 domain-containing protein [Chthoniobacterales bacterium]